MPKIGRHTLAAFGLGLILLSTSGCGNHVSFEKIDYKGHVRIERDGQAYCFKVPQDWGIREKLEDSDVVCLGPLEEGFRDSIVAKTIPASELQDPAEAVQKQLAKLGDKISVEEPYAGPDKPVLAILEHSKFSAEPLAQLVFLHLRSDGSGIVILCTTTKSQLDKKREFFQDIVAKAKYRIEDCPGAGGLPKVFPTPEVTLSPG